jgi:hypothetical protein
MWGRGHINILIKHKRELLRTLRDINMFQTRRSLVLPRGASNAAYEPKLQYQQGPHQNIVQAR